MSRIFISYKRVDKDKVFKIKDQIESALGEKCWIDLDGIESDAQFKNVIIKAINECEVLLFMYSKAHSEIVDFENDWTIRELDFAKDKKKRIVFINIDGSLLTDEFKFDYGRKQQVDARNKHDIEKLTSDLDLWLDNHNIAISDNTSKKLPKIQRQKFALLIAICLLIPLFIAFEINKSPFITYNNLDSYLSKLDSLEAQDHENITIAQKYKVYNEEFQILCYLDSVYGHDEIEHNANFSKYDIIYKHAWLRKYYSDMAYFSLKAGDISANIKYRDILEKHENLVPNDSLRLETIGLNSNTILTNYQELEIGDFIYSDGTFSHARAQSKDPIGIVFSLSPTPEDRQNGWTHGYIVSLKDVPSTYGFRWDVESKISIVSGITTELSFSQARKDYNGFQNCRYGNVNNNIFEAAIKQKKINSPNFSNWFVPSVGQWCDIIENLAYTIVSIDSESELGTFDYSFARGLLNYRLGMNFELSYWCSTQYNEERAWCISGDPKYGDGTITNGDKDSWNECRLICAF